jgi:hypothetical protein
MQNGYIPTGKIVCHKCDNTKCVNIDHVYLGSYKDNTRDSIDRGRSFIGRNLENFRGEKHPASKLTDQDIRDIRADKDSYQFELASKYKVTQACISNIQHRKTWAHVE